MTRLILGPDRGGGDPPTRPGEIARGDYWSIVREGADYLLCHVSGDLFGREQRLRLTEDEANAIASAKVPVELFIAKSG